MQPETAPVRASPAVAGVADRRRGSRRLATAAAVGLALAVAGLSLLVPWSLAFDPWAWAVWGREVWHGGLDTSGGPSWKPLPVVITTALSWTGSAVPALWLVVARAGGLLALAGAHRLAGRLVGPLAAWTAVAALAVSEWWLFNTALGNSEGLLAAAVLWATIAHLDGRTRLALAIGVAAALLRPEAWPFLALYAVWLARAGRERAGVVALIVAPVPLLWFGPDVLGPGGALGASEAARGPASAGAAAHADVPGLQVLVDFLQLLTPPVALAAVAGALWGGRTPRRLGLAVVAWVAIVAVMAQAGYAGNPRYTVAAAAVCCVLAGVGAVRAGQALAGARAPEATERSATRSRPVTATAAERSAAHSRAVDATTVERSATRSRPVIATALAVAAAALAFTAPTLADQVRELGDRADRRSDLGVLLERAGGAAAVRACAPARTNHDMSSMVAWRLDIPPSHLADRPRTPVVVLTAPAGYTGGPSSPAPPDGADRVATAGAWSLFAACADGRAPTAPAAPG